MLENTETTARPKPQSKTRTTPQEHGLRASKLYRINSNKNRASNGDFFRSLCRNGSWAQGLGKLKGKKITTPAAEA